MGKWSYVKRFEDWYYILHGGTQRFEVFSVEEASDIVETLNEQENRIVELKEIIEKMADISAIADDYFLEEELNDFNNLLKSARSK